MDTELRQNVSNFKYSSCEISYDEEKDIHSKINKYQRILDIIIGVLRGIKFMKQPLKSYRFLK